MHGFKKRTALALMMLLILVSFSLTIESHVVSAGRNGQLIGLYCNTRTNVVDWMSISGTNQNGQRSYFAGAPSNADTAWVVWDWWWVGTVDIWWHVRGSGGFKHLVANIPRYDWFDIYIVGNC